MPNRSLLVVVFLIVGLLNTGCGTTKTVGPNGKPHRSEINEEAEGNTATVTLRNGEELELQSFRIDADSASGLTEYRSTVSVASSRIERVKFTNRAKAALIWGGSALGLTGLSGQLLFGDSRPLENPVFILGLPFSLLTAGTAALAAEKSYQFETPPSIQEPQAPAEEKGKVITENQPEDPQEPVTPEKENEERTISNTVVDTQIPKTSMQRPDDIAVVIGNRAYKNGDIPNVDYAVRDARVTKKYLTRTLGFREENVIYVENASGSAMTRIFGTEGDPKGQLHDWVKPNTSDVFVYYSGHGAPNPESGNAYLLPSNANPSYLSQNGYPLTQLYENLAKIPAESVSVVLEACFSGTSEGGAVVQNASPAVLSVENPVMGMENGLALTAGATDQVASWYPEKKHGLFTYYFLKGLRGNADTNSNNAITAKEMESYLNEKVPYRAQRMHSRKQTPVVVGQDLDRVLVRYKNSPPASQPEAILPAATTAVQPSVKKALSLPSGAAKVTSVRGTDTLQQGDVITALDGTELASKDRLSEIVNRHSPGDTLQVEILREGNSRTVSVTLEASE